jgi:hypothetical protein
MATPDFTTDPPTRFAATKRPDGQNKKIQIATPGVVFRPQVADRPARVVPAASGWTVPGVQRCPINIEV